MNVTILTNACNNFDKSMPYTTWFGKSLSGKATLGLDLGLMEMTKWLTRLINFSSGQLEPFKHPQPLSTREFYPANFLNALRKTMPSAT